MKLVSIGLLAILVSGVFGEKSAAITCQDVRLLTKTLVRHHFYYNDFGDMLSERTFDNLLKNWDPSKLYFLSSDVNSLRGKYQKTIDDQILKADCKFINEVADIYSKRFFERHKDIKNLINLKHDFTLDEYMIIDPDELEWAKNGDELKERWRKRIKFQHLQLRGTIDDEKIVEKLTKRYELAKKRHNELGAERIYGVFLNAFSSSMDPHSTYYAPKSLEEFRISTRLALEGIGAVLRSEDGLTKIMSLVKGGAAEKTGKVKVGDKIVAVAQGDEAPEDVIDMDLSDVVRKIRGKRGTTVKLSIVRESESGTQKFIVPIVRERIQLEDRAAKSYSFKLKNDKKETLTVGVLDLPSFYLDFQGRSQGKSDYRSSSKDLLRELEKLKKEKIDALVVDLRSNGGGSLDESISVAGLFIKEGPVVQIRADSPKAVVHEDEDESVAYDGPLVVLTNVQSASASEIFAGAIKDHGRGLIVGDPSTFGKGTVQNMNEVSSKLGALKVTISKFYTPSGSSTQMKGVESDIVIPSMGAEYEIGERTYDYALPWEKIPSAKISHLGLVDKYLPVIKKKSSERIAKDDDFAEVRKNIDEYRKSKEDRIRVSLKEEKDEKGQKSAGDDKSGGDKKETDAVTEDQNEKPDLKEDFILREAVYIATDYARLLAGEKLVSFKATDLGEKVVEKTATEKKPLGVK